MDSSDLHTKFNLRRTEISSKIKSSKSQDVLQDIRQEINDLMSLIKDPSTTENVNVTIPSYELKNYSKSVDLLIDELETQKRSIGGKKKFSFKSKPKAQLQKQQENSNTAVGHSLTSDDAETIRKPTYDKLDFQSISIDQTSSNQSEYLTNITNSIIEIKDCNSIDLKDIQYSIIKIRARTSLFLTNLDRCIVIGESQQLRIHHCSNLILSVDIPKIDDRDKRMVIEACHGLLIDKEKGLHVDDFSNPSQDEVNPNFKYVDLLEAFGNINEFKEVSEIREFIDLAIGSCK